MRVYENHIKVCKFVNSYQSVQHYSNWNIYSRNAL